MRLERARGEANDGDPVSRSAVSLTRGEFATGLSAAMIKSLRRDADQLGEPR
jgi:hypothetical protein